MILNGRTGLKVLVRAISVSLKWQYGRHNITLAEVVTMIQVSGHGAGANHDGMSVVRVAGREVANHDFIVQTARLRAGGVGCKASDKHG